MSNSFRLFVIIMFFGCAVWFIRSSIEFYFFIPSDIREMVLNNQSYESLPEEKHDYETKNTFERAMVLKKDAVALGLDIRGGVNVILQADLEKLKDNLVEKNKLAIEDVLSEEQKKEAIKQIIFILERRINPQGLSEIRIRKIAEDKINIQIPGIENSKRFENVIGGAGVLEFKLVDEETMEALEFGGRTEILNPEIIPDASEALFQYGKNDLGEKVPSSAYVLYKETKLSGERITGANVNRDEMGQIAVGFEMDLKGAQEFSRITGDNIGRRLAIVLDEEVISAPNINSRIAGNGQITGNFDFEGAQDLANILKSGSMPTDVKIISKDTVGPTMGKELMMKSFKALTFGLLLVIGFMLIWYRTCGFISCIALLVNGWMIFAVLATLKFTVTLPGIAGLILTMGMAIDANVIIFERIKEEIKKEGRDIVQAIRLGYEKAFWSIFDANFTTMMAAIVLYNLATGSIDGFAFTLLVGILISMFTALFMTRFIFEMLIHYRIVKNYSWLII